jgi:protein-tyrosine phosphatase
MRILFVCMGNICRSPSAEGVFRKLASEQWPDLELEIDSAGTHDYHVGRPPDPRSIAAAARRGIDLTSLRARTVSRDDFSRFDLILAMDRANFDLLHERAPSQYRDRIRLMMEFAPGAGGEVPDPYYGSENGFEAVLDLLEEAAEGLLQSISDESATRRS